MTRETLSKLHDLTAVVNTKKEVSQEQVKTAQDRYKEREVEIERSGKMVKVTEKTLWDELFHLGFGSQAGLKLKELHPEVFSALKEQDQAADELRTFCLTELGVDYTALTLSDYLHLTEELTKLLIKEHGHKAGTDK